MAWSKVGTFYSNASSNYDFTYTFDFEKYRYRFVVTAENYDYNASASIRIYESPYTPVTIGSFYPGRNITTIEFDKTGNGNPLYSNIKYRVYFHSYHTYAGLWTGELQREPKNTAPTTPGAFTSPSGTVVDGNDTALYVAWEPSTDAENDKIYYKFWYQFDGGNWSYWAPTGDRPYYTFDLKARIGTKNSKTVRFRISVQDDYDSNPNYSYSPTYNINYNTAPTVTLNTTNNRTLYENDTFSIDGTTRDTDSGNVVNVKYQINSGTVRAIATQISNGLAFPFNKVLTFKQNKLFDGANAVTADLAEGTQHVLKVWAEDDQGGKSAEQVRTFYVVPNRPATLTIEPFSTRTDLIDSDSITINGSVSDPDNNTVTVKYKIANGSFTEVYNGGSGSFSFNVTLAELAVGANTITVQAVDSYGAITSKTLSVNKAENNQPLLTSVARYKLTPPNGTAKGIVLWIQREVGDLVVDAEISMGMNGQAENFQPMTKESTAFVTDGIEEDEFTFDNVTDAENIVLKLTMTRSSVASDKGIKLISGVLS